MFGKYGVPGKPEEAYFIIMETQFKFAIEKQFK